MSLRKERAAKGLCPECGAEAAPYYLCDECHRRRQVGRILREMTRQGFLEEGRDPNDRRKVTTRWTGKPGWEEKATWRGMDYGERGKPRLRGVPVDVETELVRITVAAGRPMSAEEIAAAWVRLRPRPGRPAAPAMAAIVAAGDKRARKRARNAALAVPSEGRP